MNKVLLRPMLRRWCRTTVLCVAFGVLAFPLQPGRPVPPEPVNSVRPLGAVSELLQSVVQEPVSSYTDIETLATTVSSYLSENADGLPLRKKLARGLATIKSCGLKLGSGRISARLNLLQTVPPSAARAARR